MKVYSYDIKIQLLKSIIKLFQLNKSVNIFKALKAHYTTGLSFLQSQAK